MAQRNASCLVALVLLASVALFVPGPSSFIAASPSSSSTVQGRGALAQGLRFDSRSVQVS
eukprot:CAMPEP_0170606810 /NCGR_PEP_ID=MMETSP0224-20130122/20719_1 /TAXON_ID=285029 /ORGANISM="Togula jolla, Strain CCCM 725" /LENGTH=59 /DNA_ID=CAMNT_0010931933 /DNA_START=64 /DNA_END=239 /DNA_ORIENTATION=-